MQTSELRCRFGSVFCVILRKTADNYIRDAEFQQNIASWKYGFYQSVSVNVIILTDQYTDQEKRKTGNLPVIFLIADLITVDKM